MRAFVKVVAAGIVGLVAACSSYIDVSQDTLDSVVERSATSKPPWITSLPQDAKEGDVSYTHFRGIKTSASSLENGQEDARQSAKAAAIEMIHASANNEYTRSRGTGTGPAGKTGDYVQNVLRVATQEAASGIVEREIYYEKHERKTKDVELTAKAQTPVYKNPTNTWDVYVLVRMPSNQVKMALWKSIRKAYEDDAVKQSKELQDALRKMEDQVKP